MSNLKERIGRKVGYNNKSWIRPGYQVKQSPPQQPRIRQQISTAAGYESDRSSHEEDSGHCDRPSHPGFRNSARSTSLLERMGISPGADSGDDDEDTEAIAKSLFERVGLVAGVETVHGTFSSARTPDNVHRSEKDQESVNALAGTLTTAQPLANDPVCQSCFPIVFLSCHCHASIGKCRHCLSQPPYQRQRRQRRHLTTSGQ
ncbi:hypothetical protein M413DRAFT_187088 [Hebeloma cylindrosporum]|uniref:Uncharacterized protein n=1 Tax=Hebeloma cylindrosporum TaxID=76867 RepID=A0A0C2XQJ0_HEBCY|nr:hypothetical protein M413DRAFT_187088 [Hebeloma cylindrosporum h7]